MHVLQSSGPADGQPAEAERRPASPVLAASGPAEPHYMMMMMMMMMVMVMNDDDDDGCYHYD